MWPTFISLWLALSRQAPRRPTPRRRPALRRPSHRLRLEALEDRCLLSAGALDPTFGNGAGYVTTSLSSGSDIARATLIQADGKIIAAGGVNLGQQFGVVRYNQDGTLDTSFGSGGTAEAAFPSNLAHPSGGAVLQGDGKIVMAGLTGVPGQPQTDVFALARFNANGTLDATFGNQGKVTTSFSVGTEGALGVVIQSDGKIVAVGDTVGGHEVFELARYNADGSLDTSFGTGGEVVSSFAQFPSLSARSLLVQADGKLIVVGDTNGNAPNDWVMVRYNANGIVDTSFGNQGVVATSMDGVVAAGSSNGNNAAVLYPNTGTPNDGKIVVEGGNTGEWELVRYNANGSLDTTFGNGGKVVRQITGDALGVALDANGRPLVTGDGASATELARFNLDGTPDTTFGSGGVVTTTIGVSSVGRAVAVYPNAGTANDGDIVVAGSTNNGSKVNFAVARYLSDSTGFVVSGFPSPDTAGMAGTFTVTARDASGNLLTGYTGTVHFTSSDARAVLPADYTFTAADNGAHTFSATLLTAGSQSITATDTMTSTTFGGESGITVTPAAASQFILSAPSGVKSGSKFSLILTVEDAYGNVVTGYVGTVHFTSSDGTATLPKDYTFTAADAGVHTFTNAAILKKKGKSTITVTDTLDSALAATDSIAVV